MSGDCRDRTHEGNRLVDEVGAEVQEHAAEVFRVAGLAPVPVRDGSEPLDP